MYIVGQVCPCQWQGFTSAIGAAATSLWGVRTRKVKMQQLSLAGSKNCNGVLKGKIRQMCQSPRHLLCVHRNYSSSCACVRTLDFHDLFCHWAGWTARSTLHFRSQINTRTLWLHCLTYRITSTNLYSRLWLTLSGIGTVFLKLHES